MQLALSATGVLCQRLWFHGSGASRSISRFYEQRGEANAHGRRSRLRSAPASSTPFSRLNSP